MLPLISKHRISVRGAQVPENNECNKTQQNSSKLLVRYGGRHKKKTTSERLVSFVVRKKTYLLLFLSPIAHKVAVGFV
jgi:stage III sporulation protein SpoIIIAA